MAIDYSVFEISKGDPRKRTKAREKRKAAKERISVHDYVFARERYICRCCRLRRAESMHELQFRSLRGKASRTNSIAVCGAIAVGLNCHALLQHLEIDWTGGKTRAEGTLYFKPRTQTARDHLRVTDSQWIESLPMRAYDVDVFEDGL